MGQLVRERHEREDLGGIRNPGVPSKFPGEGEPPRIVVGVAAEPWSRIPAVLLRIIQEGHSRSLPRQDAGERSEAGPINAAGGVMLDMKQAQLSTRGWQGKQVWGEGQGPEGRVDNMISLGIPEDSVNEPEPSVAPR